MTSILKVDTIQDQAGNNIINESSDTITIGASGDTITIPSGATISNLGTASGFGVNTPAFSAYLSASQTINNDTHTTATFNTEIFDTDSNFDTSTYRFTPTTSGKYLIGAEMMVSKDAAELRVALMRIRKNNSTVREVRIDTRNSTGKQFGPSMVITGEANGSSDYFDVSFYTDTTEATSDIAGEITGAIFYGYKIIE
jgi:hypothetical protein